MKFIKNIGLAWVMLLGSDGLAWGQDEIFDFFADEANVLQGVTASRLPLSERQAPATVYVVTAEDIATTGAQTLWDALRGVPGVDVMTTCAFYGEVSIRGLNKSLNNRTLVLLDGRPVLNGPFDSTFWEGLPVVMTAIDQIEVVLGPASALYGANALNGVINIITKLPSQARGGSAIYSGGEKHTHLLSATLGDRGKHASFLIGAERRKTNQFENPDARASDVYKVQGKVTYDVSNDTQINFSSALVDYRTQFAIGVSKALFDGTTHFLRTDLTHDGLHVWASWNRERPELKELNAPILPFVWLNTLEATVEQTLFKWDHTHMVVGGSIRRTNVESSAYSARHISQNRLALFYEHAWNPDDRLTVVNSARVDRHPTTGWEISPRGSIVFSPGPQHVFRVSLGAAFRNPAPTESFSEFSLIVPVPIGQATLPVEFVALGNTNLKPERIRQVEVGHTGRFGAIKTTMSGFHYRFSNMIAVGQVVLAPEFLPTLRAQGQYNNIEGVIRAWGGEVGAEIQGPSGIKLFANMSYQHIRGILEFQVAENGGPTHKFNLGIRWKPGGWTSSAWVHRVDATLGAMPIRKI
jgi:iron complex outermembrane receptor protein